MKITASIQARMNSSRLPGKVLMKIGERSILERQIERVKRSRLIDEVIIATTISELDNPIVDLCQKTNTKYYRGSEEDVFGRIASLLKENKVELHVELIGDSPFSDPQIIDEVIGYYLKYKNDLDYVSNGTKVSYPSGMEVNVYPASVLIDVESKIAKDDPLREHVDIHLSKNSELRRICLKAPFHFAYPDIYLEVDTEKDFQMVSEIFHYFDTQGYAHFSLSQILDYLKERPDLIEFNQKEERRWKVFKDS